MPDDHTITLIYEPDPTRSDGTNDYVFGRRATIESLGRGDE